MFHFSQSVNHIVMKICIVISVSSDYALDLCVYYDMCIYLLIIHVHNIGNHATNMIPYHCVACLMQHSYKM